MFHTALGGRVGIRIYNSTVSYYLWQILCNDNFFSCLQNNADSLIRKRGNIWFEELCMELDQDDFGKNSSFCFKKQHSKVSVVYESDRKMQKLNFSQRHIAASWERCVRAVATVLLGTGNGKTLRESGPLRIQFGSITTPSFYFRNVTSIKERMLYRFEYNIAVCCCNQNLVEIPK